MKPTRLLLFIFCLVGIVQAQELPWEPTNGPYGGPVRAGVVDHEGLIFVSAGTKGVYRSNDEGISWTSAGLQGIAIAALATNSAGTIFASSTENLYASTDHGVAWQSVPFPGGALAQCVSVSPTGRIVVGTTKGIVWCANFGDTWVQTGGTDTSYKAITYGSTGSWIAGSRNGIRRSADEGSTWTTTASNILAATLCRDSHDVIFAGSSGLDGVYRSTDDGLTWQSCGLGGGYSIACLTEASPTLLLAGLQPLDFTIPGGVQRTTNSGGTWQASGLENTQVDFLLHLSDQLIIAGTYLGLYRSTDGGLTWLAANNGFVNTSITGLFTADSAMILAAANIGIFRSVDRGMTWVNAYPDLDLPNVLAVAIDADKRLFFSTSIFTPLGGIYRSTDNGVTWTKVSASYLSGMYEEIKGLVVAPNGHVFAGHGNLKIYRSTDHGDTWERVYNIANAGIMEALAADSAGYLYAARWSKGILRSTDDGTTWLGANTGISDTNLSSFAAKGTKLVFAAGNGGVFRSTNSGDNWDPISSLPTKAISIAIGSTGNIIASFVGGEVYRSTDDGISWALKGTGLPASDITALSGSRDGRMYAGTNTYGVYTLKPPDIEVPIQLTSFTAVTVDGASIVFKWTTASEINNYGFYIQMKRPDDAEFSDIAGVFVPGHGTTIVQHSYSYTVATGVDPGTIVRLKQVDLDGTIHLSEQITLTVTTVLNNEPLEFALDQNFPNPFNPTTVVSYQLPAASHVRLVVYDLLSREVAVLVNEKKEAGTYEVKFEAAGLASGMYIYRLQAGNFLQTRKMLLMK